ncbi:eEF1A lysine and N-terminal methyltransferase [Impatiens glandulifera]|uniref:eEF1A lysine and N-terminal methyltransferase n=1 Tax=Impatiens glandulifera TaxID=253017 RepID=UPI001FB1731F|nr:eEF1A lysine and N-terminal methyltransferase [Impatiens glandulifera]
MSLDDGMFEALIPSRFIVFTIPNSIPSSAATDRCFLHTQFLRIAVLDSPQQPSTDTPRTAAMFVPLHRENDWIFTTEAGHLQLLFSCPEISRLILVGNDPSHFHPFAYDRPESIDSNHRESIEVSLTPLLFALSPRISFRNGLPEIPFLAYEDEVIRSVITERCIGSLVGEMIVEDVELDSKLSMREFRRRLRFKRMPNLIQTQMLIVPCDDDSENLKEMKFKPEIGILVHPYLTPMVAALSLISLHLGEKFQFGNRPNALCLGVGGGALLSFLNSQLGFDVVGVEADEIVLAIAKRHFGLQEGDNVSLVKGDAIKFVEQLASGVMNRSCKSVSEFDVIMVDLDSTEASFGMSAPSMEFVEHSVLVATRLVLSNMGIVIVNVISPCRLFYEKVIHRFRLVFNELYEIDVDNGENRILIGSALPIAAANSEGCSDYFLGKLRLVLSGAYMNSLHKL